MDLYIDSGNLKSFIASNNKDDFDDCLRMLKRQLHINYNMDKMSLKNSPELLQLVLRLGEGRGDSEKTDTFLSEMFPDRPIKSNSYTNWDRQKLSSVYLIDDWDCRKLKEKGCVLLGDVGEELSTLTKLFCGSDYNYHHLYDLQKNFNSWEQLVDDNQMLPCTDIVINDRYIFKNEQPLIKCNLSPLLGALTNGVKGRVNVVVYTKHEAFDGVNMTSESALKIIVDAISGKTGIKPNVTLITSNDNNKISHDRFIITNYRLIRSGDSFIYFDTNGNKITKGGSLDIDSMANHETSVFVESLIKSLQDCYNSIIKNNNKMIYGDRVSNFIKFG